MKVTILIGLLVCLLVAFSEGKNEWNFNNEIKGEWALKVAQKTLNEDGAELKEVAMNLTAGVHEDIIMGTYVDKESEVSHVVRIQSDNDRAGVFQILKKTEVDDDDEFDEENTDEEEGGEILEFQFNFEPTEGGYYASISEFSSAQGNGVAHFLLISKNSFVLTLYYKQESEGSFKVESYEGARTNIPQPGLLARYGPMMLMVVFFGVSQLIKSKYAPQMPAPIPEAPADKKNQ